MNRRLVFAGIPCRFSRAVFTGLVDAGIVPVGVIAASREAPAGLNAARALGLDPELTGIVLRKPGDSLAPWLTGHRPDLVIVACFPWRISAHLRALAPEGWLNVHPSLLPIYRGPEPVFWALRNGNLETGVTLHLMDDDLDTGPIVAQATTHVGDQTMAELEHDLARHAVALIAQSLAQPTPASTPQAKVGITAAPFVQPEHLIVWNDQPVTPTRSWLRALAEEYGPLDIRDRATGNLLATVHRPEDLLSASAPDAVRIPFPDGQLVVRDNKIAPVFPLQTSSNHPERTP